MPPPPLEGEDEDWVADRALRTYGVFSLHLHSAENTGYPDRLYFVPGGRPLFIEHKRGDAQPTERQLLIHARLRHAGYEVQVHNSRAAALAAVAAAVKKAKKCPR